MLFKVMVRPQALTVSLSVAFLGLMSGLAQAQDAIATDLTSDAVSVDEIGGTDVLFAIDPIETDENKPVNLDGIGDGEPLPDVVFDDGAGEGLGEEPEVTTTEFPDSTCGGCEYQTMSGGPEVQRDVLTPNTVSQSQSGADASVAVVSDDNNICYNADLYIPLLCDWQRPFVGDLMP